MQSALVYKLMALYEGTSGQRQEIQHIYIITHNTLFDDLMLEN
jgi:hypothetical protein